MRIALIVNNPVRDLAGLTLVARHLCGQGATCYLVPRALQWQELGALAPDFVLLNQLRRGSRRHQESLRELLDAGMKIGVLDDEGGVFTSFDQYGKQLNPDPTIRHRVACFCSWGTKLAEHARREGWYLDSQIAVTGAPRFDFYAPPWRDVALADAPQVTGYPRPLVLISGKFSKVNPLFITPEEEARLLVRDSGYTLEEAHGFQRRLTQTLRATAAMTNRLAARFPDVTFVYRPHPFERLETYYDLLDKRGNLHLTKQGAINGWLRIADAVIQRGSTTAIEAGMMGVPALSPRWIDTPYIIATVEAVSIQCASQMELEDRIEAVRQGCLQCHAEVIQAQAQVIKDWFCANDGESHRRVASAILAYTAGRTPGVDLRKSRAIWKRKFGRGSFRLRLRHFVRHWRNPRGVAWDGSEKGFDAHQVRSLVQAIRECQRTADGGKIVKKNQSGEVGVALAGERGDYHVRFLEGRSVTLYPL